jgi:hypothetical protein
MTNSKPILQTGSMLNTSEGLVTTGALAALTTALTTGTDWRVQAAAALGLAVLASAYVVSRSRVKASEALLEEVEA